jgi:ubiquinone biosynthesis monooxygenase Coq7
MMRMGLSCRIEAALLPEFNRVFKTHAMFEPHYTSLDRALIALNNALDTLGASAAARRPSPANGLESAPMSESERRDVAGLMRINHTGEVCAQALYLGQAALARNATTRAHLLHAADEEADHLAWCGARLRELHSRPSLFNPLWYAGSYALGALAACAGDGPSLGFVAETERQVEAHLQSHLERLPATDDASRAILEQMKQDEARHARQASAGGGTPLPWPVPRLMRLSATLMKAVAYRI